MMNEFDVHFDDETIEKLRRQICDTVTAVAQRADTHIGSFDSAVLCTRLMSEVEEKLFEIRDHTPNQMQATIEALETILFGNMHNRSRDELEARAVELHAWSTHG